MQSIEIAQMTWKDKFDIFCVKGERLIVKNKKKRIIGLIILVLIILTAGIFIFGHNHINSQKNEKKSLETKSDINKNTKKEKVETIKEDEEQQEESKEEELAENKKTTKTVEQNKSSQKTTTGNSNNNSNSNSNKNYSAPANTQNNNNNNNQQQEVKQEAPKPVVDNRTAWEKLGISEYDYYHTEMYGARVDLYNTDISFCNSEARRILNSYEDVANTRSYSGTGKYTYSYIGCSVDVTFYDGRTVGYNEAKRILGF